VIDPAVQRQAALFQPSRNRGVGAQVLQLRGHILFGQSEKKFGAWVGLAVFHVGVAQPGGDVGIGCQRLGMERAFHDAAIGVAADDHLGHAQHAHRIFDGSRDAADGVG